MTKLTRVSILLGLVLTLPAVFVHAQGSSSLSVRNGSDLTIMELYVSRSGREYWGANLLGGNPLQPTRTVRLPFAPDRYDLKLVDHEGYACITQIQVSGEAYVHLTNEWLRRCEGRK